MEQPADPPSRSTPAVLASDGDRERMVVLVRDAVGEGRLTPEEFSRRVGLAQRARPEADLASLTADLPARVAALHVRTRPPLRTTPKTLVSGVR